MIEKRSPGVVVPSVEVNKEILEEPVEDPEEGPMELITGRIKEGEANPGMDNSLDKVSSEGGEETSKDRTEMVGGDKTTSNGTTMETEDGVDEILFLTWLKSIS